MTKPPAPSEADTTHIVALSGGKDSSAMALRLAEVEPETDFQYVYTPTGDEPPAMEAHWRKLECLLGKPLVNLVSDKTLFRQAHLEKCLPNHRIRWCTRLLKIDPFRHYAEAHAPCIVYVGLRIDEGHRVGAVYDSGSGVTECYPMRDLWKWNLDDVLSYLDSIGVVIPQRTDCEVCFFQTLPEWYMLWKQRPEKFEAAIELEAQISALRGKPCTLRNDQRDTWSAGLADLRAEFESGRVPRGMGRYLQLRLTVEDRPVMCRICSL